VIDIASVRRDEGRAPEVSWGRPPVLPSPDLQRILALPRRRPPDESKREALMDLMTERLTRENPSCRCAEMNRPCITRLRAVQAWALYETGLRQGLLGPINVGDGKTLVDILAPLVLKAQTVLLLVPAKLVDQLVREYLLIREHFRVPALVVHGDGTSVRSDESTVLHVISYERLSRPDATSFLEALAPGAIIADEVHHLANAGAVRTGRLLRYFAAHKDTRFCCWSGSMTDDSLKDYWHFAYLALREGSPLPSDERVVEDWAGAIDPSDSPAPPGALARLCSTDDPTTDEVRAAFHRRLTETSGVVTSPTPLVRIGLTVEERPAPEIPKVVADALDDLRGSWCRPDGEELVDALAFFRCARELACGFFYRWVFKRDETREEIDEWLDARKAWRKEVRNMLYRPQPQLDSPHLLEAAAHRARQHTASQPKGRDLWWIKTENGDTAPCWDSMHLARWLEARPLVNGGRDPETEPVYLHPYLAEDAAAWAREQPGIVWYEKKAFGLWVAELAEIPLHGGGPGAGPRIATEKGDRSIVASIKSHGEGRDGLQYRFHRQLVAHPPSGATTWEQLLGRLHRTGQERDVATWFYSHTEELEANLASAISRANYVQSTIGARQKLLAGTK
jgi:hypothetical protein